MSKLTEHHTLHLSESLNTAARERAKDFPSFNAYVIHCITRDVEESKQCHGCMSREIADSVMQTLELAKQRKERLEPEVSGRMVVDYEYPA